MKNKVFATLREVFFPSGCPLCGGPLLGGEDAEQGICANCAAQFPIETESGRCEMCGIRLISEIGLCIECRVKENRILGKVAAVYSYAGQGQILLRAYKFKDQRLLANFFAQKVLEARKTLLGEIPDCPIVPVPPRHGKLKKTGWDQIETIARILEKKTQVVRCLKRLPSLSQKELNAQERAVNLKGRILCTRSPPENIILFDDVYTTGATLETCAEALKEAGAKNIYGLCLFHT